MGAPISYAHRVDQRVADRYHIRQCMNPREPRFRATDLQSGDTVELMEVWPADGLGDLRALKALRHPRLQRVLDGVEAQGQRFIASEWLEGQTLASEIYEANLPPVRALSLLAAVCEGLAALHGAGLRHGQLSAAQVIVGTPASPQAEAGPEVVLTRLWCPAGNAASPAAVVQDLEACLALGRSMLGISADDPALPPPLRALLQQAPSSAAELGAACRACLAALSPEERAAVRPRPPAPPPALLMPVPTNWSPPPPPPPFHYRGSPEPPLPRDRARAPGPRTALRACLIAATAGLLGAALWALRR